MFSVVLFYFSLVDVDVRTICWRISRRRVAGVVLGDLQGNLEENGGRVFLSGEGVCGKVR